MGDGGASRIRHDLVQQLIRDCGEGAYTVALGKITQYEGDDYIQKIWKDVLNDLDEHFKQGEGQ